MAKHVRKRRALRTALTLLLAGVLAALFIRWDNSALQITHFEPSFTDLPDGFDGCRIVVLGDLHTACFGEDNTELLDAVRRKRRNTFFWWGTCWTPFMTSPRITPPPWRRAVRHRSRLLYHRQP